MDPCLGRSSTSLMPVPATVARASLISETAFLVAKREVEKIRALNRYASVLNTYMEEAPLISDWPSLTSAPNVVVVPFFISDGLHSYEDIPVLLGIAEARPGESVSPADESVPCADLWRTQPCAIQT